MEVNEQIVVLVVFVCCSCIVTAVWFLAELRSIREIKRLKAQNTILFRQLDNMTAPCSAGWRDILDAPEDGTTILVYDEKPGKEYGPGVHEAFYDKDKMRWTAAPGVDTDPFDICPTHWLPSYVGPRSSVQRSLRLALSF